ncbi:hypothetical protein GCM10022252_16270 [Streptosporangium oxazolinicum]|uniref:Uncharacterized protein n=1 Tax=Streptosporangium oxazolinicum TaxID=909287 RepID=A0ABP8AKT4_9ACTN
MPERQRVAPGGGPTDAVQNGGSDSRIAYPTDEAQESLLGGRLFTFKIS